MPGHEGSRCLTRQEQVASYSRALVMTAATATTLRVAVLLRRMSLSRSRVCPGVCTKAHEGVFQGAPRGGAHTSPPRNVLMSLKSAGKNGKSVFISGIEIRGRLETTGSHTSHIFSATQSTRQQDSKLVRVMLCLREGKLRIIVYSALRIFEHHCYSAQGH